MRLPVAIAICLLVASCGSDGGVTDVATLPPQTLASAGDVQVVAAIPPGAVSMGALTATSCQEAAAKPKASQQDALAQLKVKALNLGANAVGAVSYAPAGASPTPNCLSAASASGTALRLSGTPVPPATRLAGASNAGYQ